MTSRLLALLFVLCGACGAMPSKPTLRRINNVGLGLAVGSIACDWGQTRHAAEAGWAPRWVEDNPVLGAEPSVGRVDAYMLTAIAGTVVVGRLLPDWAQPVLYAGIIGFQTRTIIGNHQAGIPGPCGR